MFRSKEEQFDFYWKEIFTGLSYNPIEFNTYRFDQTMSLPGKVNKLYDMFKVLAMNNQEVMDYLKAFVETFDVKLYETIDDILSKWLEDGILTELIRNAINEEVVEARNDYSTLKERLDSENADVTTQLAQTAKILRDGMSDQEIQNVLDLGGTIKIVEDMTADNYLHLNQPTYLISDNKSTLTLTSSTYITINAPSKIEGLVIKTNTTGISADKGVINVHAPSEILNCEIDGQVLITADYLTSGVGGYGIAIAPGGEGTVVKNNYIHNISNSFIEAYHNNTGISRPQIPNLTIEYNTLENSETGDGIAVNTSHSSIRFNKLLGKWENGMLAHPSHTEGVWCENVVFEGNYIDVNPTYQYTKNGYGIALRYGDDLITASRNCVIRDNVIKGWGHSGNGVEAIRIDDYCVDNVIENNVIGGDNTPNDGVFIRIRGDNNIIRNNNIKANRGSRCIHLVKGTHHVEGNTVISNADTIVLTIDGTMTHTTLTGNHFESTVSTSTMITLTTPCVLTNNTLISRKGATIFTNTTIADCIITNNRITSVNSTALMLQSVDISVFNNNIIGGSDVVVLSTHSSKCKVEGNIISMNPNSVGKRDAILVSGANHTIKNNKINSSGRNAIHTTFNCIGDIVVSDNEIMSNAGSLYIVGNTPYILYVKNNSFNGNAINSTYGLGKSIIWYNSNYTITNTQGHTITETKFE